MAVFVGVCLRTMYYSIIDIVEQKVKPLNIPTLAGKFSLDESWSDNIKALLRSKDRHLLTRASRILSKELQPIIAEKQTN